MARVLLLCVLVWSNAVHLQDRHVHESSADPFRFPRRNNVTLRKRDGVSSAVALLGSWDYWFHLHLST